MEFRASISTGMYALLDDKGIAIKSNYVSKDTIANLLNIALSYGKEVDRTESKEEGLLGARIIIDRKYEDRFVEELNIITKKRPDLGRLGYVLGLHSGIYIAIDSKTKKPSMTTLGYSARVSPLNIQYKDYMFATISKSVYESKEDPYFFEDYIYLSQLNSKPEHISNESFDELLNSLDDMINKPALFISLKGRKFLAKRYLGIVVGMMVRWGFKKDIRTLMSVAMDMSMEGKLKDGMFESLVSAYNTSVGFGDL